MKVLVAIPCLLTGGTEIQTLSLVDALMSSGHEVAVACYFEFSDAMVDRYLQSGAEVILLSPDGKRPSGVISVMRFLYSGLKRVVKKFRPDVAHVQYMAPGALSVIALRACGVRKIVATAHTFADIYPSLRQIHILCRYILTAFQCITLRAEKSFFGSDSLFSASARLARHNNHFTIYNNLPSYISIADNPRAKAPVTIGVVSRLEEIKGMDMVVPAFARIASTDNDIKLLIVGDGSLRHIMERQVSELGLMGRVEFAGRQPQSELQGFYDRIDVLLMPSRSEGFGLTAIEGMARGCVPVVADIGGLPEVVEDGVSGLLHRPEDLEDMADEIRKVLMPDRFKALSKGALDRSRAFSRTRYQVEIANLYSKIAEL